MYYVADAIEILKKYGYYADAEVEIKRKKIATAPYDMKGHYDIYCTYLSKIWVKLREKLDDLQSIDCLDWDNLPKKSSLRKCTYVSLSNPFCVENCKFYQEKLKSLIEEKDKIAQIEKDLKRTAEEDYWLR